MSPLRRIFGTLSGRVVGVALVATSLFGVSFGAVSKTLVTLELRRELLARGTALGEGLRASVADAVATNDRVGLNALVRDADEANPSVRYVLVLGSDGQLLASTLFRHPSGAFMKEIRGRVGDSAVALRTEVGVLHDLVIPTPGAEIHVGMPEAWVDETLTGLTVVFASAAAAAMLACLVVAWRVSRWITRPLGDMARAADAIARAPAGGGPARDSRIEPTGLEEVDAVTGAFNRMAASLDDSRSKLAARERQMIRAERMAAIGAFAAGTAHAINNPLGGLQACVEMLDKSPGDAGRIRRYTTIAQEAVARIRGLVDRLVQFVRQGGGVQTRVDVNAVVERLSGLVGRGLSVRLIFDLAPRGTTVIGDPSELEQALTSLVVNAIQASPENGAVRVSTRRDGADVHIVVEDHGAGIPEPLRDKVFEPFFTTKPEGEGTGLGLWVVWGVAERHGGRIQAGDRDGGGARMTLTLPAAPEEATRA